MCKSQKLGLFAYVSLLLFIILFEFLCGSCNAYTIDNTGNMQLRSGEVQQIIDRINLTTYNADITTTTNTLNAWLNQNGSGDFDTRTNLFFFKHYSYTNRLYWVISTGGITNGDDVYFGNSNQGALSNNVNYANIPMNYLDDWILNGNGEKIGVTTKSMRFYYINPNYPTIVQTELGSNVPISMYQPSGTDFYTFQVSGDPPTLYLPNALVVNGTQTFCGNVSGFGFLTYYQVSNRVVFTNESIVTPTPTPTPTDTPSGESVSGSVDLTPVISSIDDVKDEITTQGEAIQEYLLNIEEKISTSGDIVTATVVASNEYWGNSGDLNEDAYLLDLNDSLEEVQATFSGELNQIEAFSSLQAFQNRFKTILLGTGILDDDFRIHWDNVNFKDIEGNNHILISSGEVNFSKLCRDYNSLGNLLTTIRILFNFSFGFSLVVYIYNLVLSTLGIDNPFLYEDPERIDTAIIQDINEDTGTRRLTTVSQVSNRKNHSRYIKRYHSS